MNDRYQLFSVAYARRNYMLPYKPVAGTMRLAELAGHLESMSYNGCKDWFVWDSLKDVYVDPDLVRKLTMVSIEGVGYPECPCCETKGISMADHTNLPNCRAKR